MANILDIIDPFEIEIDSSSLIPTLTVDDVFYLQDLKQRKLYFNCEVTDESVMAITRHILQYNTIDDANGILPEDRQPILLYMSSMGGSVDAGLQLIDVILLSKTPIYTININCCYSMGCLIAIAGKKRFAFKNSKYLMHDGTEATQGSMSKVRDRMEFYKKQDERIKQYVLRQSKITSKEYDKNYRIEWFLFADAAKEKGFVDYIVGEDTELDEII